MVRVLFADIYFDDGSGSIRGPGYIYLKDGVVVGYGEGEPPEELALAEMVISGEGLVAYPGFSTVLTIVELYPFRHITGGKLSLEAILDGKSCPGRILDHVARGDTAYYAALMAFYELSMLGVTRPIVLALNPSEVGRAMRDAGLTGAILVPRGCGVEPSPGEPPAGINVIELSCKCGNGGGMCVKGLREICIGNRCVSAAEPPVHLEPWLSPWHVVCEKGREAYQGYIIVGHRLVEPSYEPLRGRAHMVVVDVGEPPGWTVSVTRALAWSLGSKPRIEVVVAGGTIVVDGGEHLYLGRDAARRASEKLEGDVARAEELCRG